MGFMVVFQTEPSGEIYYRMLPSEYSDEDKAKAFITSPTLAPGRCRGQTVALQAMLNDERKGDSVGLARLYYVEDRGLLCPTVCHERECREHDAMSLAALPGSAGGEVTTIPHRPEVWRVYAEPVTPPVVIQPTEQEGDHISCLSRFKAWLRRLLA